VKAPDKKPEVKLIGEDGNVFFIIGKVRQALKRAGSDKEYIDKYVKEATSNDYNHALYITAKYVDVV